MHERIRMELLDFLKVSGKSRRQAAKEIGLSTSVISQFLNNAYTGDNDETATVISQYLTVAKQRLNSNQTTPFIKTLWNTQQVLFACNYAHVESDIVLVCGDAGAGKTTALKHYANENTSVIFVTANACATSSTAILKMICDELGIQAAGRRTVLMKKLVAYLHSSNRLIIVDEADHLSLEALQAIRNLNDSANVGIVLAGNDKIYRQMYYGNRGFEFDQIRTRIVVRKKVSNEYSSDEMRLIFPDLSDECIAFLLTLACRESLRTAIKIHNLALKYSKATNKTLTLAVLRNTKNDLLGEEI